MWAKCLGTMRKRKLGLLCIIMILLWILCNNEVKINKELMLGNISVWVH